MECVKEEIDREIEMLSEAFQVCDEFDRNFDSLKKDDAILQMKELDVGGDMMKIELDCHDIDMILKNEA